MEYNGVQYRDWRKIAEGIREGKSRGEIKIIYVEGACVFCVYISDCVLCPLCFCVTLNERVRMVFDWLTKEKDVTRAQALRSAELIAEIIEGSVCLE